MPKQFKQTDQARADQSTTREYTRLFSLAPRRYRDVLREGLSPDPAKRPEWRGPRKEGCIRTEEMLLSMTS